MNIGIKIYDLLRFFNYISILRVGSVGFISKELDIGEFSINRDMIILNYPSILNNGNDIFFDKSGNLLSIWSFNNAKHHIVFPESYLVSKVLNDGIYLIDDEKEQKLMIIKNSFVLEELSKNRFSSVELNILSYQYNLNIIRFSLKEYNSVYQQALANIGIKDILLNLTKDSNISTKLIKILKKIIMIFFIVSIGLSIYTFTKSYFIKQKYLEIETLYKKTSKKTIDIHKLYKKLDSIEKKSHLLSNYLTKKDTIYIYLLIVSSIDIDKYKLESLKIDNNHFYIKIYTKDAINLIDRLDKSNMLYKVKITENHNDMIVIEGSIR